jgi:hypothetical protein
MKLSNILLVAVMAVIFYSSCTTVPQENPLTEEVKTRKTETQNLNFEIFLDSVQKVLKIEFTDTGSNWVNKHCYKLNSNIVSIEASACGKFLSMKNEKTTTKVELRNNDDQWLMTKYENDKEVDHQWLGFSEKQMQEALKIFEKRIKEIKRNGVIYSEKEAFEDRFKF